MRIFRANYKDRAGQKIQAQKYYIETRDHNRILRRLAAFTDKKLTESLGRNIETLVNHRIAGLEPDRKLNLWIEQIPESLLKKFISWGLIEGQRAEITKPLTEHIRDYEQVLRSRARNKDFSYAVRQRNRLIKICKQCRFDYFRDITKSAVEVYSGLLKKRYSDTSRGHFIGALVSFLNWAEQDRRIIKNPISKMEKPQRDSERKGILTPEQFIHLIKTTFEKNVLIGRITGQERAVLYLLAGCTGIRRKELLNLCWDDVILSGESGFVCVKSSIAKNGKAARQPIPLMVVNLLAALKADITPKSNDRVFLSFGKWINTAELIRNDLTAAQIELIDREGNKICFHSLRNCYISYLADSPTPAKVIQKLARHSDPRLTFNTYARTFDEAEQKAINFLPNFGDIHLAFCLAHLGGKHRTTSDSLGNKNYDNEIKTAFLPQEKLPPRGLEPLLPG
jgi:integrase